MTAERILVAALLVGLLSQTSGCGEPRKGGEGPEARFVGPARAKPGDNLLFDARDTKEEGLKMSHQFDFGDGSRSVISFDAIAEHIFDEVGSYTVTLTVRDDLDNAGSVSHVVEILDEYDDCHLPTDCGTGNYCVDRQCLIQPFNISSTGG